VRRAVSLGPNFSIGVGGVVDHQPTRGILRVFTGRRHDDRADVVIGDDPFIDRQIPEGVVRLKNPASPEQIDLRRCNGDCGGARELAVDP